MTVSHRIGVLALVSAAAVIGAAGCSSAPEEDVSGASSAQTASKTTTSTCPDYPANPDCNEPLFLKKMWQLTKEDVLENGSDVIANATGCIAGLVAAGAVTVGGVEVPPLLVAVGAVYEAMNGVSACRATAQYLASTGIAANLSCWFAPQVHDPAVQLCKCRAECKQGIHNSGEFGDYSKPRKFKDGYLDRAGSANCHCTDDAKAVRCQWSCEDGWASTNANDCTCK